MVGFVRRFDFDPNTRSNSARLGVLRSSNLWRSDSPPMKADSAQASTAACSPRNEHWKSVRQTVTIAVPRGTKPSSRHWKVADCVRYRHPLLKTVLRTSSARHSRDHSQP